jgi:hypothetical protein
MPESESVAIIISSIITVGGMVLIQFFVYLQGKAGSRERFFYEVFPKRLALYEEAIKELEAMIERGKSLIGPSLTKEAAWDRISKDVHSLKDLLTRIRIFGSVRTMTIFTSFLVNTHDVRANFDKTADYYGVNLGIWIDAIREMLEEFIQAVRKDTGGNFVDRIMKAYFTKTKIGRINRIRDKLFPSPLVREMTELDMLNQKLQDTLSREENTPIDDNH